MGRAGDDFWFEDPNGDPMGVFWLQGAYMVNCYNILWMGQFIRPDWDMFQSNHACAAFHAASRAICGGPIYVSDSLGGHDFALLRRLVFPDGTVPRCLHYALPTRDCLFKNPLFDQQTVLKIWNLNKVSFFNTISYCMLPPQIDLTKIFDYNFVKHKYLQQSLNCCS
jgi:stachyose synthetase